MLRVQAYVKLDNDQAKHFWRNIDNGIRLWFSWGSLPLKTRKWQEKHKEKYIYLSEGGLEIENSDLKRGHRSGKSRVSWFWRKGDVKGKELMF